jgi:eukaryotic-like serine/threonine-protein kinase
VRYELGSPGIPVALYPAFVRGNAHLELHQGAEAATEFQKLLDHRGIVLNETIGALAHLPIARAYAMQSDTTTAKAAYQDSSRFGKTPTPIFRFLSLQRQTTRSFISFEVA